MTSTSTFYEPSTMLSIFILSETWRLINVLWGVKDSPWLWMRKQTQRGKGACQNSHESWALTLIFSRPEHASQGIWVPVFLLPPTGLSSLWGGRVGSAPFSVPPRNPVQRPGQNRAQSMFIRWTYQESIIQRIRTQCLQPLICTKNLSLSFTTQKTFPPPASPQGQYCELLLTVRDPARRGPHISALTPGQALEITVETTPSLWACLPVGSLKTNRTDNVSHRTREPECTTCKCAHTYVHTCSWH